MGGTLKFAQTTAFVLFYTVITSGSAHACYCHAVGKTFFETVSLDQKITNILQPPEPLTIVTAEVKQYVTQPPSEKPTEMVIEVTDVLQGKVTSSQLTVQGDDGGSCMPYVTRFPIGKRYLFALNTDKHGYYLSVCGVYYMELNQSQDASAAVNSDRSKSQGSAPSGLLNFLSTHLHMP
jgi:hypothetical protein